MKKFMFFMAAAAICLLSSCEKAILSEEKEENVSDFETEKVTLTFSPVTVTTDAMMRTATDVSTIITRLDVWIVEGDNVTEVHQSSTDTGFGTMTVELNKTKTYTLYACGHKANGPATLTNGVIAFPEEKVTHSFFSTVNFSPATTTEIECSMNRIVGMFRFETTDAIPNEVTKFRFLIPQTFTRWNVAGYGANAIDRTSDVNITSRRDDGSAAFTLYIIGSSTETNYDITVQALDSQDGIIQQRLFEGVPIRNNWKTTLAGTFFVSESVSMSFVADDWSTYDTIGY